MLKRIIAMLMAIVLLLGNVPVQTFAAEDQLQATEACVTENCTFGAGHTGECSTFVACGKDGCTFEAGHAGNCSSYVEPKVEPAKDAAVYVTVSNRGELGMAYEEVTVSDLNQDGKLSVDEALYAAHTVYGKGYASENGTVTKLWDVETTNVSFFVNHEPISTDVSADTIRNGDYLVASVDEDVANDYDKYSRFHVMEKSVDAGKEFILTLVDNEGTALAGMEIGLSNGNGTTTMLGLFTDENGQVALTLNQEGLYCVTAKGTLVEQSYNLETEEYTSIETPIIAPVCVMTVSGNAEQEACATEGCTFGANHEGNCSNYAAPAKIRTAGNNRSSYSVTVGFTVVDCLEHNIEIMRKELTVTPRLALQYFPDGQYGGSVGLTTTVGENDVTPIDVLVAAHLDEYGDAFVAAPYDYISGFDYAIKMFGEDSEITWTASGNMPYVESEYGGTGYAINQYIVQNGDEICFYRMSYFASPASVYASFNQAEATVNAGEELTLRLGYCATMDYRAETIAAANTEIYYLNADGSLGDSTGCFTDANGMVTLSFAQAGTYYLTCMGEVDYMDMMTGNPTSALSPAYIKITVTPAQCQHTNTTPTYTPVDGHTKHTVTVTCDACGDTTEAQTTEACVDEDKNNTCDRCKADLPVAVESVSLDQATLTMTLGDNPIQLTATVNPDNATNKTVKWESSNTTVVTADNGLVTAIGAGTTTVTVMTGDGGKTAACEVTVKAAVPSYPFTLTVGGETLAVTDLGATEACSCGTDPFTPQKVKVTVPAGTQAVDIALSAMFLVDAEFPMKNAGDTATHTVTGEVGDKICLAAPAFLGHSSYHIYIEIEPCETHTWQDATCKTPKTCSVCGATEGEADPDAHKYVSGTCEHCGEAKPVSYPFTMTVGGETLAITDLGTVECTKNTKQAKAVNVTVPAGTTSVKLNSVDGMLSACVNHESTKMVYVNDGESGEVNVSAGTYLCTLAMNDFTLYHITIEFAPCVSHDWQDATCTTPKTCSVCGETEGDVDADAHSYVDGTCEYCGEAEPVPAPSYTVKISEAEELTAGLNYFASVPAEGMDLIIDFGSGTISGAMCQRHCSKRDIWTAGEGSTFVITADKVAAHYCNETQRAKVASDFNLYLTEGSKLIAFYWWTSANLNGSYLYLEILPAEELCTHETWNAATCKTPKTCANCGATEGEANPDAHNYVGGTCEYCGEAEPVSTPSYIVKISEAEELTAGLNYFASVPAEGMDLIIDFGSGTFSGGMCQRHCSDRSILKAGEGSTFVITADKVAAHYCNETQRAKVASDFNLYLTEGSKLIAFYWWTSANLNGSYLYLEILPAETDEGGGEDINRTYNLTLPKNPVGYSIRATSPSTVNAGGEFSFKLNVFGEYKKTENFKVLANGVELTSTGNDNYKITNVNADQTVTVEGIIEKTLAEKNVTVNVPAGATVTSGLFHSYFKYDFVDALEVTNLDDGRVQYIVPAAPGGDAFIRVQHPDGVTYWDFGDLNVGKTFNITEEMLFVGSTEYTKDTVFANYEKNEHDTASLYLTANAQGWLDMNRGETHSLNVFRNWIPVSNSTTNTGVSLPDVTYTVVDVNGNPSSGVVTVTPDANNSCYADIQAVGAGTAIILVTYDAVYNADGEGGKQFSAIWPENTGVIVVTVDAEDANIQTNITVNEEVNAGGKQILDVEHDILFYVGDEGAEYSFTPESGCTVTVACSNVGATMTFSGFTSNGVDVVEDGTVTLSGLTTGAHIVKVEKNGKTAYQVIRTRQVNCVLKHSDGTEVTSGNPAQPGETITVQFSGLIDPMGKLSGVYNAKYGFRYVDEAGAVISIASTSPYGEYFFGSTPARQRFNVTVPAEWTNTTYTLSDGSIMLGGWGSSFGAHRATTYLEGKEPNLNASGTAGYASVLPEITIPVENEIHATEITLNHTSLELDVGESADLVAELKPADAVDDVVWTSGNTAIVTVTKDGEVTARSAGTAKIIATAGTVTAECSVTVYEVPESEATVYFSVSHDANYLKMDQTNKVVALQKLTVPYFDLALYGLEQYKVDRTDAAYGKPTMLHLYLYATEIFQLGVPEAEAGQGYLYRNNHLNTNLLTISGAPGSLFMNKFWGMDENLNYYHNYEYPADETGYGMTADRVALNDGDIVTIGHFTSWSFYSDPSSVFNYLAAGEDTVETTAVQNQEITLKLYHAGANMGNGGANAPVQRALDIYYTKADDMSSGDVTTWTLLGTTEANGELKVAMPEAGTFILAVAGQKGTTYTKVIVSTPGAIILNVTESGTNDPVKRVIALIDDIGDVTLDKEDEIKLAREEYAKLSSALQKNVSNYNKLTEAEQTLDDLKNHAEISNVVDLIEKIGSLTPEIQDDVEAAREAYDNLTEEQKADVSNYEELLAAEKYLQLLELSGEDIANIYQTTGSYLSGLEAPTVGSTNGEWRVIGLARAGQIVADAYYNAVVSYVQANIDSNERLHASKATENARVILALTAIGKDITDVGGHNLLRGLNDMTYIRNQGINGPIWTLIALDSHNYTPVGITRQDLLNEILGKQLSDGGWSMGTASDVDMTAMAIQALAPYYDKDTTVKAAVDKALNWLSAKQNTDGSFSGSEGTTSESLAQVITALTAMGINPETDTRFVKNGISTIDALAAFYVEGGGFRHGTTGDRNMMATEQGYYALVSYFRLLEEKTSLYDMSDVTIETSAGNQAAANAVIDLINDIGTVDLTKEDEITAARTAYNALTDAQKALISASTLKKLTDAETELAQLKQTDADSEAANAVKELIDAIGTVTLEKENAITTARNAYNRLTTLQKNLVGATYLTKLTTAEAELAALKKAAADEAAASAVEQKIAAIGTNITLGSESKITTARNAYNALTADQKALVSNYQTLVNAENALSVLKSTVSVTFSLKGCYKHGSGETSVHTLSGGNLQTWIAAKTYKVQPGATVKDLFEKALSDAGLEWKNPTGNYVESIKYNGDWIGEFTNGQKSGWMYTLNGKHPNLGVAQQTLVNGDVVVFHYTDDYTKEEGSTSSGTTTSGNTTTSGTTNYITTTTTQTNTAAAESVDRLIEDIGEEITLDSAAKIKAARAAYDKLTEAQKKLVKKYDDLVAAEKKLVELKGVSAVDVYAETGNYIQGLGTPGVGAIGGEWMVIGLARSGRTVPTGYYDHVLNYVRENINNEERLHSAKSSDNSRVILALTAIGKDVTNVDGHDLLRGLNSMDYIQKQGINGPIWALIAFDSGNYPVPAGDVSREKLSEVILEAQLDDGGWAMSGDRADPDLTGMAIQALAPYMDSNAEVKKAVEEAVWTLSRIQNDNGSFSSVDGPSSESIAQVIVALAALGIDADTDARFVKNGISALDALLTYFVPGGGFRHVLDGNLDGMATEQAYYALVAYNRMKQNQNFLYDMTDVIDRGGDVVVEETTEPTELPTEPVEEEEEDNGNAIVIWTGVMTLCAGAIVVILLNRKKLFGKFL